MHPGYARTRGLIFGGSSGIGAAITEIMAEQGCEVITASRRGTTACPAGVTAVACDVRDADSTMDLIHRMHGIRNLDWVVNAAGVGYFATIEEPFAAAWRAIVETNVLGMLAILAATRTLRPPLTHLVQIGSLAANRPSRTPGNDVYSATKTAVVTLLAAHRRQLRIAGVRTKITLVTPGYVGDTDFSRNFFLHAPELQQPILDRFTPLSPVDVARVVAYALAQPSHVELGEIMVRAVEQDD